MASFGARYYISFATYLAVRPRDLILLGILD